MKAIICLLVVSFASLCVSSRHISQATARIVGGEDADIKDFPYQVSICLYGKHICGGSIIAEKFVLTAKHCTYVKQEKHLTIRTGSSIINEGGKEYETEKVYRYHVDGVEEDKNDIAIIKLAKKIVFGVGTQPVIVNKDKEIVDGWVAVATGWGSNEHDGPALRILQKVYLPVMTTEVCKKMYTDEDDLDDNYFCAGFIKGGQDTCQGDSGGPLVWRGIQIGIVSTGDGCAEPQKPGIYVKLSKYKDFIEKTLKEK